MLDLPRPVLATSFGHDTFPCFFSVTVGSSRQGVGERVQTRNEFLARPSPFGDFGRSGGGLGDAGEEGGVFGDALFALAAGGFGGFVGVFGGRGRWAGGLGALA